MYAVNARAITEIARQPKNAWHRLFERIKEEAENGNSTLIFDEEKELVMFSEHRKEVKNKLEELGYECSYRRVPDNISFYANTYHNEYTVSW